MLRKPQSQPQEESYKQPGNRITLPEESGIRNLAGFKEFLTMAESSKGSQFELSWVTKTPGQRFVLDLQWDANQKAPFWTLYEENNGKSRRIWDEPVTIANIDMCYDVLVMTCGGVDPSTKNLAEILKSAPVKEDYKSPKPPVKEPAEIEAAKVASAPSESNPVPDPNMVQGNNFPANQNPSMPPGYMYPPGMPMPVNPGMGFPMSTYNVPPNMQMPPNMPGQPVYPANMNPASGQFANPAMPQNAWQYGANMYGQPNAPMPPAQNMPMQNMPMQNMPMQNMPMQNMSAQNIPVQNAPVANPTVPNISLGNIPGMAAPSDGSLINLPVDNNLFNKQNDMSLVDLLVKAELITEMTLAAALKIHELIHTGKITKERAVVVLKNYHSKGDGIENYMNAPASTTNTGNFQGQQNQTPQNSSQPSVEDRAAFALLLQAGLVTQDDLRLAQGVINKHGGDIASILQAAQKLDKKTFEAAKICCDLHRDNLMKVEQAVIVVNYCSRSRVGFDEALSELNWPNPRKQAAR